jgi:uncharacterized membrane protein HdeD (DUF308 family)
VVVFHVVPPPAIVSQDGRVILDPKNPEPIDLWPEYRQLQADTPKVAVQYAVVVGDKAEVKHMLEKNERPPVTELRHELTALRGNWLWFVLLGVALIVLGFIARGALWIATLATAIVIGALLVVSGVAEIIDAFWSHGWSGFFLHLLSGVLPLVIGLLFLRAPVDAVLALTLLLACLLMVGGIFKIVAALSYRFAMWGWPLVSGVIDLILGVLIWLEWPASGLWVIGLFVGISLLFRGFSWIGLGLALRTLPPSGPD